jgi:hypothetical protein
MSDLEDLEKLIPIDQVAAKLGVDEATARSAVNAALPALVGGLHANAQDPAGAASLSKALATKDPSSILGGVSLDDVDDTDGAKIVKNIFGANQDQVIATLGSTGKASSNLLGKLLPILAPIVMAYIANKVTTSLGSKTTSTTKPTTTATTAATQQESGGGLTDVLGSILGGGSSGSSGASSGGLGSILGGLLGGGSSGGGIGDILGGLLGGGKK